MAAFNQVRVDILITGNTLSLSPDPVPVWVHKDRVHWFLIDAGKIDTIHSKKNHPEPFSGEHTYKPTDVLSCTVENENHKTKLFPYTVVVTPAKGSPITFDPNVQVMPPPGTQPGKPSAGLGAGKKRRK
jgi:hypothetical protein